ncbi:MAG: T9SS type A sorting domain-containing protein [Saprospiraceae bacterium]|nr:T9SS type A sorting domain-containing protein [Saprospiraceae bacterium]MBK9581477.1 T9SS type A sorting domain-containing protein [Saprospiraceae bacterium]
MDTKIWSATGSLVYNKQVKPDESINISNLFSGLYFVTLDDGSGQSVSLKFVK